MQDAPYRQIPLHRRDGSIAAHALIDEADAYLVEGRPWHIGSNGYARSNGPMVDGYQEPYLMHRMVLDLPTGDPRRADHINRDRLDNRRANLRVVTHGENLQNQPSHRGSTSRFRAVYWSPPDGNRRGSWRARTRMNGRAISIGTFASELEAGLAVEAWRRENMPFATPDPEVEAIIAMVRRYAA